jgi:hypothetical protein
MKQMILLIALGIVATETSFAHGHQQHVMGTVTAISGDPIKVRTKPKGLVVVYITSETKYERSGEAATVEDLEWATVW